jgi:crossover junction endodeoxyribonuclease RuvC
MKNIRVIGIDPGSETTGWGIIEGNSQRYQLIDYGCVKASPRETIPVRLMKIYEGLETVIARFLPVVCAVEETFFATNVKSALKLGQARGVALLVAARANLQIHEYSPRLVKQTVVGYGAAEKHQVQEMVRVLLKLPSSPQPHDAADAIAIAICHMHHAETAQRILAAQARIKRSISTMTTRRRIIKSED